MILYHGSNLGIENPLIIDSKRALDFGKGFYLTTDLEQAKKWAILMTKCRECGYQLFLYLNMMRVMN